MERTQNPFTDTGHATAVYETLTGRVSLEHLRESLLCSRPARGDGLWKRGLDLALVVLSLPIALLLMLIVAVAIKIEEPGASLWFWQERIGRDGRPFRMVKLRSMRADTTALCEPTLPESQTQDRTTRVGRFIRRYRLDELPQFWHVLRGEMSVIGPRPEQVPLVERYAQEIPFYPYRHRVKPGITGWAQVNQGYATGTDETRVKLQYDLYYVQRCSLWLDLLIVIRTFGVLWTGFGAR
jgi:lipopolysaccharide/colanic/teichoic acid biosynthesis glycosyltransferase